MTRATFFKHFDLLADQPDAVGVCCILKGCWKLAGGKFRLAKRHPRSMPQNEMHPEGVLERAVHGEPFRHPFRVDEICFRLSGGIALLNPRLISGKPSACSYRNF